MSARLTLSDLPPALQKQAAEQLSRQRDATASGTASSAPSGKGGASAGAEGRDRRRLAAHESAVAAETAVRAHLRAIDRRLGLGGATAGPRKKRGPNKTEAAFRDWFLSTHLCAAHELRYEAMTLLLPGGSRYTPDWVCVMPAKPPLGEKLHAPSVHVLCYEVKGTYRLGSHGRALTAFREARAAFPGFKFRWFRKAGGGQFTEEYKE
jgi:hypothetical protein